MFYTADQVGSKLKVGKSHKVFQFGSNSQKIQPNHISNETLGELLCSGFFKDGAK